MDIKCINKKYNTSNPSIFLILFAPSSKVHNSESPDSPLMTLIEFCAK